MAKSDYDTALARIAGNIAANMAYYDALCEPIRREAIAQRAVMLARQIVEEIRKTEPK